MLFSAKNPPPGYYHYLYLREDGTPYYSGKGKGIRAWKNNHTINLPIDHSRIIITHWGLTEMGAFILERWHIRWYGRRDLGNGILRNRTNGGDGASGLISKFKGKAAHDFTIYTFYHESGIIEVCTRAELREKYNLSTGHIGKLIAKKIKNHHGWRMIPIKEKWNGPNQVGKNNKNFNSTVFSFIHDDERIVRHTRYDMQKLFNLNNGSLSNVINRKQNRVGGWRLLDK